jgi:glutamine synthetase
MIQAEYIWVDGTSPTRHVRSKTKVLKGVVTELDKLPLWGFDGSSTGQGSTKKSDVMLVPVKMVPDPLRGADNLLVLCETKYFGEEDKPHESNTRAALRAVDARFKDELPRFGIEQEYTLYKGARPYGWGKNGFPPPQGKYYCGVGSDEAFGAEIIEAHTEACIAAGLSIEGTNAEVMPGQWEFQIGALSPLEIADQLWLARWLLYRVSGEWKAHAKLTPKPMPGDWNGAGAHTNFSTAQMRAAGGLEIIRSACNKLRAFHSEHIKVYGHSNDQRLTGVHETSKIDEFTFAVGDRSGSIRIPQHVAVNQCGYLEDRRPAANMDPYQVATAMLETVCGSGFNAASHGWTEIPMVSGINIGLKTT